MAPDREQLTTLARMAYEESLRRYGVSTVGPHAWENQTDELRLAWGGIVRMVLGAAAMMKVGGG